MKKFIVVLFILLLSVNISYSKSAKNEMPAVKFSGTQYSLYYSAKSKELGGYMNEYYKKNQGYTTWNELIGVYHYPDAFYPIELAKDFKIFLDESGVSNNLTYDDKNNTATLDFVVMNDKRLPIIMEFNIFKYQKSPICGSTGMQYAKRYYVANALEVSKFKHEFAKNRKKYLKKMGKAKIPDLISKDVEKGVYVIDDKKNESDAKAAETAAEKEPNAVVEDKRAEENASDKDVKNDEKSSVDTKTEVNSENKENSEVVSDIETKVEE